MKRTRLIFVAALGLALGTGASAMNDISFLRIDGIPGESGDAAHKGHMELLSYSFGATLPAPPPGPAPAGVATGGPGTFKCVKKVDKASPILSKAAASGRLLPSAQLEIKSSSPGTQAYMKYELKNVMITSYSMSGQGRGDSIPTESISFNYGGISIRYAEQKAPPKGTAPNRISAAGKTVGGSAGVVNPAPAAGGQPATTARAQGK